MTDRPLNVLLVEDNDDNVTIYSTILGYYGYGVTIAGDGETALRMIGEEHPALILMDISIPGIDGWEVTARLKADPATRTIPIIALTAHALAADRERAESVGCDGFITKPADPRSVVAAVERFIGTASPGNPTLL